MYSKGKHDTEWKTSRGTIKSSLRRQKLVHLLVAPLQGQAHRRCPFVVGDPQSLSSTRQVEQKPCQAQQAQPHRKMHQCFPRHVLWEERRRKKKKWEFVGCGLGECHIPTSQPHHTPQLAWSWQPKSQGTCSTWKNTLVANVQKTPVI